IRRPPRDRRGPAALARDARPLGSAAHAHPGPLAPGDRAPGGARLGSPVRGPGVGPVREAEPAVVKPRGLLVGALYGLTLLAVFTPALASSTEFDFWWSLAPGERILAPRSIPATDPFSYTAQGQPWINHMWASQLVVLGLWQTGGRIALILLKSAIVTATFA